MDEMNKGWVCGKGKGAIPIESSLKMITSHINILPTGNETGVYFAVDLGGTNLRILRVTLNGGKWSTVEHREAIPMGVSSKEASAEELFDFIARACGELCRSVDADPMPVGFTFSFPYSQTSIKAGCLIEWTKGFETQGCVGKDPAALLQAALDRNEVPLVVEALCNDTVGTLMTNAYTKRSKYCRVGVILGTGTNAAYSDPSLDNLIINIEWGGFNKLPRRSQFDEAVDAGSPNVGKQFLEKMVSGFYLGELARLATVKQLETLGTAVPSILTESHAFDTAAISQLLENDRAALAQPPLSLLTEESRSVLLQVAELVMDRSAAVAAAALSAVVDKATIPSDSAICEVGIDGSLYTKGHEYKARLLKHLRLLHPAGCEIVLDFSEDGSGLGAALVAAAVAGGEKLQ